MTMRGEDPRTPVAPVGEDGQIPGRRLVAWGKDGQPKGYPSWRG